MINLEALKFASRVDLLQGLHPDLVKVVHRFARLYGKDFMIVEGMRNVERQRKLVASGASQTMNSRHLTGHAVDIAPMENGKPVWDWQLYYKLAKVMKKAAIDEGVIVEWGGDWKRFKDGPHWQLPFSQYPKTQHVSMDVDRAKPYTNKTEAQVTAEVVSVAGAGAATGAAIGAEPLAQAVGLLTSQQDALSSGDWIRIALGLLVIGLGIWAAFKRGNVP
jgi:peptidoglycan LD-endopeptidase CwlK